MSDVIIYEGAAIPFSFSRQNGQPLDVTSVMRTLADITTYAANTEKKYVPYEGQTIACLEDKMLYILELKNGVLIPKLSGGVKLIKRDDNVELTDDAAMSALRSVKEIEDRAISRTKRDRAAEVIEFAKGLTAANGKTTVSGDGKVTTLNLLVQVIAEIYDLNVSHVATMMRAIIKDYVSSEAFTPGLTGEGFKISKAINGDWNLEIDNIVVRKVMTIFEMVISKVRSVNGGLVISSANGRIKSVAETTGSPTYYVIGIEGDMQFVVDDYVRCQVFSNGHAKFYCVRVSSISNNSILVLKSEFANGAVPAIGDDLVQMGNATNTSRQGIIYLTASEDGKPRISVMDGVNSTSLVGKNKVILGCLDGITDTDFPADFQPSGYGLYAMNVFLKGVFLLRNGKSVEGEIEAAQNAAATAQAKADMITRLFQEFTVAGGLFESKITEVKEYADGKVAAVQVGGRNLLFSTNADYSRWTTLGGWTVDRGALISTNNNYQTAKSNAMSVPIGSYMLTFNVSKVDTPHYYAQIYIPSNGNVIARFNITGIGKKQFLFNLTGSETIMLALYGVNSLSGSISITDLKLERGNKPTDWTPAPEDVTADAQAKANAAQAAAEAVAIAKAELAKTEASAYADGIVTAEEQRAIADAQAKLAEAKLDAAAKADEAKQAAISDAASKYPTKSEVTSSINQKADEINLSVTDKISGVQVGGRNLVLKSNKGWSSRAYNIVQGVLSENWEVGASYSITLKGVINSGVGFGLWRDGGYIHAGRLKPIGGDIHRLYFVCPSPSRPELNLFSIYNLSGDNANFSATIDWIKIEKGNKSTDWTPAPEDVQSQITENRASIQVLSDQISLKVSNDTFNALGNRVSAAEATLTVQATQIASKVSQSDFNALGQRVGSAESAILQQADQISLKASKSDLNTLSGRVSSTEAELRVHATEIGLKVTAGDVSAGMTITPNKITMFGKVFDLTGKITFSSMASDAQGKITAAQSSADKAITDAANSLVTSRNNIAAQLGYGNYDAMSAAAIAGKTIINGGKIRTELIDATAIVTGSLVASVISATNITTGRLTVTDNAKIGEFLVQNNSLVNYDFRASLQIGDSDSLRYVKIGGDSLNLAKIQVAGDDAVGLNITTYRPTIGRFRENFAIKSVGSHRFKQRDADDIWDAPGVLWAGRVSALGTLENEWGNACAVSTRRTSDGKYTITHGLGHSQYYAIIQCTPYATDGWRYMIGLIEGKGLNSFDIALIDVSQGFKNCAFEVFIVGRNKF